MAGIIGGTYGTRVWAGGIYDKYVASHVTDVVADTLEKTGGDLAQAIHALTFLPQSIQQKLIDTVSAASSNAVPQVVNALEPLFLPVIQAVVFLSSGSWCGCSAGCWGGCCAASTPSRSSVD